MAILVPGQPAGLLAGGKPGKQTFPDGRRLPGRQHGRQGGPFRRVQFRPVRHRDDRRHLRRRQFHARFLHPAGRADAPAQHPAGRSGVRGRGIGALRHAGVRHPGGFHRRIDGRPHPGIPRQEDRGCRCQALRFLCPGLRHLDPRPDRLGGGQPLGDGRPGQPWTARLERDPVCVFFRRREQRQRFCGSAHQHSGLQHHPRPGHAGRPFFAHRPGPGPGREPGRQESRSRRAAAAFRSTA